MKIYEVLKPVHQKTISAVYKGNPQNVIKYFHNIFDNGLTFRIYREFLILNNKKANNIITNWTKNLFKITRGSSNFISGYSQKNWCRVSKRYLYIHGHSSVINNS